MMSPIREAELVIDKMVKAHSQGLKVKLWALLTDVAVGDLIDVLDGVSLDSPEGLIHVNLENIGESRRYRQKQVKATIVNRNFGGRFADKSNFSLEDIKVLGQHRADTAKFVKDKPDTINAQYTKICDSGVIVTDGSTLDDVINLETVPIRRQYTKESKGGLGEERCGWFLDDAPRCQKIHKKNDTCDDPRPLYQSMINGGMTCDPNGEYRHKSYNTKTVEVTADRTPKNNDPLHTIACDTVLNVKHPEPTQTWDRLGLWRTEETIKNTDDKSTSRCKEWVNGSRHIRVTEPRMKPDR